MRTKHILAAGIKRVVYIEPYPKSRAKDLHQNEIEIEKATPGRVYRPFGITISSKKESARISMARLNDGLRGLKSP